MQERFLHSHACKPLSWLQQTTACPSRHDPGMHSGTDSHTPADNRPAQTHTLLMTQLRQATWSFAGPSKENVGLILETCKGQLRVRAVKAGGLAAKHKVPMGVYLFSVGEQPVVGMTAAEAQKLIKSELSKGPMKLNLRFHESAMATVMGNLKHQEEELKYLSVLMKTSLTHFQKEKDHSINTKQCIVHTLVFLLPMKALTLFLQRFDFKI